MVLNCGEARFSACLALAALEASQQGCVHERSQAEDG